MLNRMSRSSLAILRFWRSSASEEVVSKATLAASSSSDQSADSPQSTLPTVIKPSEDDNKKEPQPTYLGYLSGVVSSLWSSNSQQPKAELTEKKTISARIITKRFSIVEVANQAQALLNKFLMNTNSNELTKLRLQEICDHFIEYPSTRIIAMQNKRFMKILLKCLHRTDDEELKGDIRKCLSVIGYVNYPKGCGVRILSIDGGGTRGMMGLEVLQALEDALGGPKVADMFDHIVGVSTGGIIAILLGAKKYSIKHCKEIYMSISKDLFTQGRFSGVSGLLLSHSYYNTKKWIDILIKAIGDDWTILDSCRSLNAPKLSIISCVVNASMLQPYIFRNYEYPPGRDGHFRGDCRDMIWQALQASTAAPGYFEEVLLGSVLHQDGGVLANNPTAIALHEARMLWPNERFQCVVSVGNGHHVNELDTTHIKSSTGVQEKITRIVDSATDTELVHLCMHDLLPANTYFRLNPYMSFPYTLDEIDPDKLAQMQKDARLYIRRNHAKIEDTAEALLIRPSKMQLISRQLREFSERHGLYTRSF